MSESDDDEVESDALYVAKGWVWSGFYTKDDIEDMLIDVLEKDTDEPVILDAVDAEFEKKRSQEQSWPRETDCDRLDSVFEQLNVGGIVALQNAGHTMSDGETDIAEALSRSDRSLYRGYCFYHGQDLERVMDGQALFIAFGNLGDESCSDIARHICKVFQDAGFDAVWNGDPQTRIAIPSLHWQRRTRPCTTSLQAFLNGTFPRPERA
jgi:hypothetical protein